MVPSPLAVTRSTTWSPSRSPAATACGCLPTGHITCGRNVPSPRPRTTLTLPVPALATPRPRCPSPSGPAEEQRHLLAHEIRAGGVGVPVAVEVAGDHHEWRRPGAEGAERLEGGVAAPEEHADVVAQIVGGHRVRRPIAVEIRRRDVER